MFYFRSPGPGRDAPSQFLRSHVTKSDFYTKEGKKERGVAGAVPSTRGQSTVVLEVQFRSRATSKGVI